MRRSRWAVLVLSAIALVLGLAAPALASSGGSGSAGSVGRSGGCGSSGAVTTVNGTLADGATYEIQCPAGHWNGTLFLYSHAYAQPGSANPPQDDGDRLTGGWLLRHGFALAGSSYATTGWAVRAALRDQIATLDAFDRDYGRPARTIAWGHSMGGLISAALVQRDPRRFAAALPMCGVLAGGVAFWNTALDSEIAFQRLVDPAVRVVSIPDPRENVAAAVSAARAAQQTPAGRARLALVAALADRPGWFGRLAPRPAARDYAAQEDDQLRWDTRLDFRFLFGYRAQLDAVAGGNPSWSTGVSFARQLRESADLTEVTSLYRAAGLSLAGDLRRLQAARPVTASSRAVAYLSRNITLDGRIWVPVLTLHTTGDGLAAPQNEQAYASVVRRAGHQALLRQLFVGRAGHCAFTPAETITAVRVLLRRLSTGHWDAAALRPAALNRAAAALGRADNTLTRGHVTRRVAAAFTAYRPARFLRPED
jgi:pimeloyl-ACP methyl ester carboxylesterase